MKLSIIVPCKNEEGNVKGLYKKITSALNDIKYELIFIDDGSKDKTLLYLKELYKKDKKHIKIISFSRNFKKEAALYAGLKYSKGEYICFLDGDLQQNPSYINDMILFLDKNKEYDQVAMVMKKRKNENKFIVLLKKVFYKIMDKISDINFQENASDFRMFRNNVKNAILSLKEYKRFSKGIFSWVGFNTKYMYYEVEKRNSGTSSFGFVESVKYAIIGITNFSKIPLIISIYVGLFVLLLSIFPINSINFIYILISLQFIFIGILGIYISNIQDEVKNRPIYIIKEEIGFKEEK